MGEIKDFLFGGTDKSAQQGSQKLQSEQLALFNQLAQQARGDAIPLFGQADADRNLGFQSAIDTFVGGRPQFQNAILGLPAQLPSINQQQPTAQAALSSFPQSPQVSLPQMGGPQVNLPQFGGTAAVFPEQQVGFVAPPTLAEAQQALFASEKGTDARSAAKAQVNQLLAAGPGTSPLSQALSEFRGLEKGSKARKRAKREVKDLLQQGSLATALQGLFSGQDGSSFIRENVGDVAGDPTSVDNIDLSTLSDEQLDFSMSISKGLGTFGPLGFSLPAMFSRFAIQQEIDNRSDIAQQVDPGNPQGNPGTGGTGSGTGAGVGMGEGFGGTGVDFGGV